MSSPTPKRKRTLEELHKAKMEIQKEEQEIQEERKVKIQIMLNNLSKEDYAELKRQIQLELNKSSTFMSSYWDR